MGRKTTAKVSNTILSGDNASLRVLRLIKSPKHARLWLHLTLSELGKKTGVTNGQVSNWESGRRQIHNDAIQEIGRLIANRMTEGIGREIAIKIEVNSPWKITPYGQCYTCKSWFALKRANERRCERCK